ADSSLDGPRPVETEAQAVGEDARRKRADLDRPARIDDQLDARCLCDLLLDAVHEAVGQGHCGVALPGAQRLTLVRPDLARRTDVAAVPASVRVRPLAC